MKISIITVCHNSENTIEDTIKSVLSQKNVDLEYIIIDGGSTDNTLSIINCYKNRISKVVTEPDKGIYDAMNKGIRLAGGEIIGILNSDDFYENDVVLSSVVEVVQKNIVDGCYCNLKYVDRVNTDKMVRFWRAGDYKREKLVSGWAPPHPTLFLKKEIYQKYGLYDLEFKIAADYELMLRFFTKGIKVCYLDKTLVCMREGGISAGSFKLRAAGWRELKRAWVVNGLEVPYLFIARRIINKIKQYFI